MLDRQGRLTIGARMTETGEAALGYAREHGWLVLPLWWVRGDGACACGSASCASPGKHPIGRLVPGGAHDATCDSRRIRTWWQAYPRANVGIATGPVSRLVVIDIDPRNGGDETWAALEAEHGKIPPTVTCLTASGGRHFYFRWPFDDEEIPYFLRSGAGRLGPGVDVKGDGDYVVAPPSQA